MSLQPVPTPEATPLAKHVTNPFELRMGVDSMAARIDGIRRVLGANSALPDTRERAKEQLAALAEEALAVRRLVG